MSDNWNNWLTIVLVIAVALQVAPALMNSIQKGMNYRAKKNADVEIKKAKAEVKKAAVQSANYKEKQVTERVRLGNIDSQLKSEESGILDWLNSKS